eukprot:Lankesteria_metandrocarpae@DN315_c0_g1_i1.p1
MSDSGISMLPLEANPEVLTNFGKKLGLNEKLVFSDVYGTEDWAIEMLPGRPVAYLLVFTINDKNEAGSRHKADEKASEKVWFTNQTVSNACGTVAVLHAVGNTRAEFPPKEHSYLAKYFDKASDVQPAARGKMLETDNDILEAHRSVETEGQSHVPAHEQKVREHFTALVEKDGDIYELDGRMPGPINHGSSKGDFPRQGLTVLRKEYMDDKDDIKFSLLALCVTPSL